MHHILPATFNTFEFFCTWATCITMGMYMYVHGYVHVHIHVLWCTWLIHILNTCSFESKYCTCKFQCTCTCMFEQVFEILLLRLLLQRSYDTKITLGGTKSRSNHYLLLVAPTIVYFKICEIHNFLQFHLLPYSEKILRPKNFTNEQLKFHDFQVKIHLHNTGFQLHPAIMRLVISWIIARVLGLKFFLPYGM